MNNNDSTSTHKGTVKFLSTEQFWDAMCDLRFYRISRYQGAIGADILLTDKPPEEIPGFIESKLDAVVSNLKLNPPHGFNWPCRKKHDSK